MKKNNILNIILYRFLYLILIIIIVTLITIVSLNFEAYYQIFEYRISNNNGKNTDEIEKQKENTNNEANYNTNISIIDTSFLDEDIGIILQDTYKYNAYPNDDRIIIPKINVNAPLKFIINEIEGKNYNEIEHIMLEALKNGVVHYPNSTPQPGKKGNFVVTGHSSYYPWDNGRYKSIFALLEQVNVGDEVIYFYKQKKYVYRITEKKVVSPDKVDVIYDNDKIETTIITCVPVGTNLNRLVLKGELIYSK